MSKTSKASKKRIITKEEIQKELLDIIKEIAPDEDISKVKPDVPLREQLDLDSMDFLDIVMEIRKRYHIEIPEEDYKRLESLDSCAEYLAGKF
ncbi:MAG: acyl carrier protein [Puniceicoccales bacterium]|jgi:acyl carrier protein|nr:acyl carrier protein [Puniceicoccales bacterium]